MLHGPARRASPQVYAVLALGVAAISVAAPLIRVAAAPPLTIASYRLVLAGGPALALAALTRRRELRSLTNADRLALLLAGFCLAAHFAAWVYSIKFVSVASSTALVTTSPLFVALFGLLPFGERTTRAMLLAVAVSTCGALVIGAVDLGGARHGLLGDFLALAGAGFAAGFLLVARNVRGHISLIAYTGVVYPVAAAVLAAATLFAHQPIAGFDRGTYGALVLLAVIPQLIGHSSLNWTLRHLSAHAVAIAVLGEPVLATLITAIFLGERPGLTRIAGCALVLAGVYIGLQQERVSSTEIALDAS